VGGGTEGEGERLLGGLPAEGGAQSGGALSQDPEIMT